MAVVNVNYDLNTLSECIRLLLILLLQMPDSLHVLHYNVIIIIISKEMCCAGVHLPWKKERQIKRVWFNKKGPGAG